MDFIILTPSAYVALAAVAFIGLPHGSLDGAIASYLGYRNFNQFSKFLLFYTLASIAVIYLWYLFPVISLTAFLFISIFHFGSCDSNKIQNPFYKFIISISHGGSIVCATIFFQQDTSFGIFEYLSGPKINLISPYLIYFYYIVLFFISIYFIISLKEKKYFLTFFEIPVIFLFAYFFHPLVTFSLYFCLIHTPRHVKDVLSNISSHKNFKTIIYLMIIFTLITWALGLIGYLYLLPQLGNAESILKVVFIGLAALTLPHMILVDGFYKPKLRP